MQTTDSNSVPTPSRNRRGVWRWILAGLGLCTLIVLVAMMNVLTLSRDAAVLRQELFSSLRVPASPQVQISVGPGLLTLARTAASLIDDVPPEARRALRAVKAASVGVYDVKGRIDASARARMLPAADAAMERRGWSRVVAVISDHDTVLIYTPSRKSFGGTQPVCLAVCNADNIVVVSAVVEAGELIELAADHGLLAKL